VTPDAAPPDAPPPDAPPPDAAQPSLRSAPFAVTGGGGSARSASYRIQVRVGGAAPTGDATSATNTSHLGVGPFQSTP